MKAIKNFLRTVGIALLTIVVGAVISTYFQLIPRTVVCKIYEFPLICGKISSLAVQIADDSSGSSITGVRVVVVYADGALVEHSDSNGVAKINLPSDMNLARLIVESDNYEIEERQIQIPRDVNDSVKIRLKKRTGKESSTIFRVVDDESRKPIAGATVTVLAEGNIFNEVTDQNGISKFKFTFLSEGTLDAQISVNTDEYEIVDQTETLTPNSVKDIRLSPSQGYLTIQDVNTEYISELPESKPIEQKTLQTSSSIPLFEDNFDKDLTWFETGCSNVRTKDSQLMLPANSWGDTCFVRPGLNFKNFVLQFTATWIQGAEGGSWGTRFRVKDSDNYYYFTIKKDGTFNVGKLSNKIDTTLAEEFSSAIKRGSSTNTFRVETKNEAISCYVNDVLVYSFNDRDHPMGDVGLRSNGTTQHAVLVAFDKFVITENP